MACAQKYAKREASQADNIHHIVQKSVVLKDFFANLRQLSYKGFHVQRS